MSISVKFKDKPSADEIREYLEKIEYFLSSLNVKLSLLEYSYPFEIHSSVNGVETEIEKHWFECFLVNNDEVKNLKVRMFEPGILKGIDITGVAWLEAYRIQGSIYGYLKRDPGNPKNGDPYWDLWDKRKFQKEDSTIA